MCMSLSAQTMTLEECLERARENNHELQMAALEIEAASEQKSEAFTNYFPRISANVMALSSPASSRTLWNCPNRNTHRSIRTF